MPATIFITGIQSRQRRNELILQSLDCADKARIAGWSATTASEARRHEERQIAWLNLATRLVKSVGREAVCR